MAAANACGGDGGGFTHPTAYTPLAPLLAVECESACNSTLLAQITSTQWTCYFQSSCRQVFGENVCHTANTSYTCK